jgi:hypothetical protein
MNSSHLCPEKRREGENQTEPNPYTRLQAFLEDRLPPPVPQKNPKSLKEDAGKAIIIGSEMCAANGPPTEGSNKVALYQGKMATGFVSSRPQSNAQWIDILQEQPTMYPGQSMEPNKAEKVGRQQ